jgi:hypothetical protein
VAALIGYYIGLCLLLFLSRTREYLVDAFSAGRVVVVDFRSMLGLIGNLFAGYTRVPKHFDKAGNATGGFRRGKGGYVILREFTTTAGRLRARPLFWQKPVMPSRHWRDGSSQPS